MPTSHLYYMLILGKWVIHNAVGPYSLYMLENKKKLVQLQKLLNSKHILNIYVTH